MTSAFDPLDTPHNYSWWSSAEGRTAFARVLDAHIPPLPTAPIHPALAIPMPMPMPIPTSPSTTTAPSPSSTSPSSTSPSSSSSTSSPNPGVLAAPQKRPLHHRELMAFLTVLAHTYSYPEHCAIALGLDIERKQTYPRTALFLRCAYGAAALENQRLRWFHDFRRHLWTLYRPRPWLLLHVCGLAPEDVHVVQCLTRIVPDSPWTYTDFERFYYMGLRMADDAAWRAKIVSTFDDRAVDVVDGSGEEGEEYDEAEGVEKEETLGWQQTAGAPQNEQATKGQTPGEQGEGPEGGRKEKKGGCCVVL